MILSSPITRRQGDPRVLSFAQEGLWYLDQLVPGSSAYNMAYSARLSGPLDVPRFQSAIHSVVERHEPLRTLFVVAGGKPQPIPLKKSRAELRQVDLRALSTSEQDAAVAAFTSDEAALPFNLSRDCLLRISLLRLSDEQFVFIHVAPHIVFEGGSVAVLYRDLAAFYNGSELPPLAIEYADFALWQRRYLSGEAGEQLAAFWREQLAGVPVVDLPTDFTRPEVHTLRGGRHYFSIPRDLLLSANRFFRSAGVSAYRGMFGVFNVFLHCYAGSTDLCVSSPFAPLNPLCPSLRKVIGYFVNTVALRTRFSDQQSFREILRVIDLVLVEAVLNCDLPFGKVVEALQPARDPSRPVLAQVNFRAPQQPQPFLTLQGIQAGRAYYVDTGSAKFDLALEVETSAGEECYFEYCDSLFDRKTIVKMEQHYLELLGALIEAPDVPLADLLVSRQLNRR